MISIVITSILALLIGLPIGYILGRFYLVRLDNKRKDQLRKWLTEDNKDYTLQEVYIDKTGAKWFAFANPVTMPAERSINLEIISKRAEMNMTTGVLTEFITEVEKCLNKGQLVEAFRYFANMKDRLTWAAEEETLTALALAYFLIEGEDVKRPSDADTKRKREVLQTDEDARGFFLAAALKIKGVTEDISAHAILTYLKLKREESVSPKSQTSLKQSAKVLANSSMN